MSTSSINFSNYLQSVLATALQNTGSTNRAGNDISGVATSSMTAQSDNGQLSPLAQLMTTLQQLQQSDPSKYRQVTQQIATNLQKAAQTASSEGDTAASSQLSQLASDFANASKSGQLPSVQDMAQLIGSHHHHTQAGSTPQDEGSQSASSILSALQTAAAGGSSADALAVIFSTLSSAGLTLSGT